MADTLGHLDVLVLDCQTTGANPRRGHLLEIAWCRCRASRTLRRPEVVSQLVALPAGAGVPRRVTKLTGIEKKHLRGAHAPDEVWKRLLSLGRYPLVIHFARFERPFLEGLHARQADGSHFPHTILCTHEIARRLFPSLPRRTLRAIAGYFGHDTPALKRAADHVAATAVIWREMVTILDTECAVTTLDELAAWLREPPPKKSSRRIYPMARDRRLALPDAPGVYHLLDTNRAVLYVGKATSLKHRVNSYFQKHKGYPERTLELLTRVREVEIRQTGSALEAALLETDEIKHHAPPYNVSLNQPDGRVWFFSRDLGSRRTRSDRRHRIGPVPGPGELGAMAALAGPDPDRGKVLAMPAGFRPEPAVFLAGLARFRREHQLEAHPSLDRLLRLGGALWRIESEDDEDTDDDRRFSWTPESVAAALAGVVRRGAHLIRRSRWLLWLCEASIAWRLKGQPVHRLLTLSRGRVVHADEIPQRATVPVAGGTGRTAAERRRDIDLATYDRLRVLTTELRRLVAARRWAKVRLAPGITLDRAALRKVLAWV